MYKVLIVDDEQVIRQGITKGNPWEEWGFKVIGQAANGIEAIEFIKENKPDVVLSDIRMSKMDGVELMQYLKQNYPEIKIVILSGYNDFEYLNMSIKNSVTEYLLKPTDVDEFKELFCRMREKLDEEHKKQADYRDLIQQYEQHKEYRYTKQINLLLKGYIDEEEECRIVQELEKECKIYFENCVVILCSIDDNIKYKERSRYLLKEKITSLCNQNMKEYEGRFFLNYEEKIVGFIGKKPDFSQQEIVELIGWLQKVIEEELKVTVSVGISLRCKGLEYLRQCYEQAKCCVRQKVFQRSSYIGLYSELEEEKFPYYKITFNEELLEKAILAGDKEKIHKELKQGFANFENKILKEYSYIERMGLELLFNISRWALQYQLRLEQIMQKLGISYNDIYKIGKLEEEELLLYHVLSALSDEIQAVKKQSRKSSNLAHMIRELIDKEYMINSISLDYIAEKVRKNSAYISKIFKNETGYNFSDYLTKKRLEKGKELLESSNLKVYEISERIGYADVSNFIKIFKKNYGSSPSEYRKLIGRSDYEEI